MKKFFIFLFICLILIFCSFNNNSLNNIFALSNNSQVSFYCTKNNDIEHTTKIKNGEGYILQTNAQNAKSVYKQILGCEGVSIKFNKQEININNFLQKNKIIQQEIIKNNKIYYLFVENIIFFKYLDNKKINLQIVVNDNFVIFGTPIILGSY